MNYAPIKRDWRKIMAELRACGLNPHKVSLILGCANTTALNWASGGEPGHANGEALLRLHAAHAAQQQKVSA